LLEHNINFNNLYFSPIINFHLSFYTLFLTSSLFSISSYNQTYPPYIIFRIELGRVGVCNKITLLPCGASITLGILVFLNECLILFSLILFWLTALWGWHYGVRTILCYIK
jgi:hypothetical protein